MLWPESGAAGQSSPSPTTKPSSIDITDASFFFSLLFLSLGGPGFAVSSHTNTAAAVITEELSAEHWALVFAFKSSKYSVVTILFHSPVLVKKSRQYISGIVSTQNCTAWDTISPAFS